MEKSTLLVIDTLKGKLLEFPTLVDQLEQKNYKFLDQLLSWIKELEVIFKNNNLSNVAQLAGWRSKIIAPKYALEHLKQKRKAQWSVAAEALFELQNIVMSILEPKEAKVEEARNLVRQLFGALSQANAVKYQPGSDFQQFVNQLWKIMDTHPQLKGGAAQIKALLPRLDILRVMSEEIELEDWV